MTSQRTPQGGVHRICGGVRYRFHPAGRHFGLHGNWEAEADYPKAVERNLGDCYARRVLRKRVNIPGMLMLIAMVATGYHLGRFLGAHWGPLGWVLGLLGGLPLPALALRIMHRGLNKWRPSRPACGKQGCGSTDYEMIEVNLDRSLVCRCRKCGTRYLQKSPWLDEILADGSRRPYMQKDRLGRWRRVVPGEG
jgi:hypothetical protein